MKHKHCEVIKAWADGADIQCKQNNTEHWFDWKSPLCPAFHPDVDYRVKPAKKQLWVRAYKFQGHYADDWAASVCQSNQNDFDAVFGKKNWVGPAVLVWSE